tara:strand:- start:1925 stop:3481 length:1557 start_codon:yes stop_codon:yes gene_type:complete
MFLIITASEDTYITNKVINNEFKAEDANLGRAGTLDLFKLFDESTYFSGDTRVTSSVQEISKLLLKFDYSTLMALTESSCNINHSSFNAKLELFELNLGAPVPREFYVVGYPLSQSFSEGSGRDVNNFGDVDAANFITASYSAGTANLWNITGSGAGGYLGSSDIDFITSGSINSTNTDFGSTQYFKEGPGDVSLDITTVLSGVVAGDIPNYGFIVGFSGSYAYDKKTRFCKRFASRHTKNRIKVPRILITWNDSFKDDHLSFYFNQSGSLFFKNAVNGANTNLLSGSSLTSLTGEDCLLLTLVSGGLGTDYETKIEVTASQHTGSTSGAGSTGIYSASFILNEFSSTFFDTMKTNDELKLTSIWSSMDKTVAFKTGSLIVKKQTPGSAGFTVRDFMINPLGLRPEYRQNTKATIRLFIEDITAQRKAKAYKVPRSIKTVTLDEAYFRIKDIQTGTIIVPFDDERNSTKLSVDGDGMIIEFRTTGLPLNRPLTIDLLIKDAGFERLKELTSINFQVVT